MTKQYVYNVHKNCIETVDGDFVAYLDSVDGVRIANKFNVLEKENKQLKQSNRKLMNYNLEISNLIANILEEDLTDSQRMLIDRIAKVVFE